jgi:hypothetical protein
MAGELAPNPGYPERVGSVYERKIAYPNPERRGPLRFEEGIATDTDVPNDFQVGAMSGYVTAPGRPNHNAAVWIKPPQETMAQRAHVGSAAWVEAPTFLAEFAHGSFNEYAALRYEQVDRSGGRYMRINPTVVDD